MSNIQYDNYQQAVIDCEDHKVVAEAKAGAGKTTTAVGFAARRPEARLLYLVFNTANKIEAQRRFGTNVECRTSHSLAFSAVGRYYAERVSNKWGARLLADDLGVPANRVTAVAKAGLIEFFCSTDSAPSPQHVEAVAAQWLLGTAEIDRAVDLARKAWSKMCDRQGKISMPHDAYLKMWALQNPILRHTHIIFDEAQDANPVLAQVVMKQDRPKLLLLGDRHQGIYLFRKASNAIEMFAEQGATVLQMPRTWRFGPRTAAIANEVLRRLKGEQTKIIGMGIDAERPGGAPLAVLSRTNAVLFGLAARRRGAGVHWVGGIKSYRIDLVLDAYHLFIGLHSEIGDPVMRRYESWMQYEEEAESTKDGESRILIKIVREFQRDIPSLVQEMRRAEVDDPKKAELVLTSGHKAKGLDWDYVRIGEDFCVLFDAQEQLAMLGGLTKEMVQEVNLLYVALTRAKRQVILNSETEDWLATHRVALP